MLGCSDIFFFKQKTVYEMRISDWSSDVCSSDLCRAVIAQVSPGYQEFGLLRDAGISVAGIEIAGRPADETALVGRLQRFAGNAGKAGLAPYLHGTDRKGVVSVTSVSVRVAFGGRRFIKKQKEHQQII